MNLSNKRTPIIANYADGSKIIGYNYPEEDVKQFIKKLKVGIYDAYDEDKIEEFINGLAGKDLI